MNYRKQNVIGILIALIVFFILQSIYSTISVKQNVRVCTFTMQGKIYEVHPCIVRSSEDGVITVGVAQDSSDAMGNPFFYLFKSSTPSEQNAFWNGAMKDHLKADIPLPGVWRSEGECFVANEWRLCEQVRSM